MFRERIAFISLVFFIVASPLSFAQNEGKSANPSKQLSPTIIVRRAVPDTVAPAVTVAPSPTTAALTTPAPTPTPFSFDQVKLQAKELAKSPFDQNAQNSDSTLEEVSYDEYRKIRFNRDVDILPAAGNFGLQTQPTGFLFKKFVKLNIIDLAGRLNSVNEVPNQFDTEDLRPDLVPALQIAGFKILFPLHNNGRRDECVVFLGASYFRPLAADQQFGSSGRGLAIDTASERGEEFPYFREFWVKTPPNHGGSLRIFALMDSQRLTGAYTFLVTPGEKTVIEVEAHLYPRASIDKVGVAPLTSMFIFGETPHPRFIDYRSEVHDSDGLLMLNGGNEWIWRPLQNPYPNGVRVTQYLDENPQGFGLMQRDTEYKNYLDLEARYDRRPSLWVSPLSGWGKGMVELVEISTAEETVDNVVAYWVPKAKLPVGSETVFSYKVSAVPRSEKQHPLGRAVRTRVGHYNDPGKPLDQPSEERIFSVDFTDGILSELEEDEVTGMVVAKNAEVRDVRVQKDPMIKGMRLWFRLKPKEGDADLRMSLRRGSEQVTETVLFLHTSEE
jgi:periplasmic glucans biosynthesis protein